MSVRDLVAAMSRREQVAWLALALLVPAAGYVGWWLFFDPSGQTGGGRGPCGKSAVAPAWCSSSHACGSYSAAGGC